MLPAARRPTSKQLADAKPDAKQRLLDELAAAHADYAAGNTISGEKLRRRYGLP